MMGKCRVVRTTLFDVENESGTKTKNVHLIMLYAHFPTSYVHVWTYPFHYLFVYLADKMGRKWGKIFNKSVIIF